MDKHGFQQCLTAIMEGKHSQSTIMVMDRYVEDLELQRDNLEIDILDAEMILQRSILCANATCCDNCGIDGEPMADALAYLEQHGWKDGKPPEQLREFVTKHREQLAEARKARDALTVEVGELQEDSRATKMFIAKLKQALSDKIEEANKHWQSFKEELDRRLEAEAALKLLTEHYWTDVDRNGLIELCSVCNKSDGCDAEHNEPCEAFVKAEERYEKFASVRKVLERMKA